jgi:hypothetical protein
LIARPEANLLQNAIARLSLTSQSASARTCRRDAELAAARAAGRYRARPHGYAPQ